MHQFFHFLKRSQRTCMYNHTNTILLLMLMMTTSTARLHVHIICMNLSGVFPLCDTRAASNNSRKESERLCMRLCVFSTTKKNNNLLKYIPYHIIFLYDNHVKYEYNAKWSKISFCLRFFSIIFIIFSIKIYNNKEEGCLNIHSSFACFLLLFSLGHSATINFDDVHGCIQILVQENLIQEKMLWCLHHYHLI